MLGLSRAKLSTAVVEICRVIWKFGFHLVVRLSGVDYCQLVLNSHNSQRYMLGCRFVQNYTFIGGWVGGRPDFVVIIPPQPSQAEARLGFWRAVLGKMNLG